MTATSMIEGQGVGKTFRDFWGRPRVQAVVDVDISVPQGSVFGLLGPNGAGKSTLIKMLLGHLYPTSGRLTVLGKHPTDVDSKSRLGYLPERSFLYRHLTPMQTLRFFGQILELPADVITARSEQLLDMVGLRHAKDRIVGEFSHGMGRRMGLAQALLNDPDLLLLDEPTAGLDPLGCREVKDVILTLARRGKTILLTSHLLADVEEVCDELLILYGGKVQARGKSQELLAQKSILQLTMPMPDEQVKMQLQAVAAQAAGAEAVELTSPIRSLENLFLDVVRQASQTQETQGAHAGRGVAAYLRPDVSQTPETRTIAETKQAPVSERRTQETGSLPGPTKDLAAAGNNKTAVVQEARLTAPLDRQTTPATFIPRDAGPSPENWPRPEPSPASEKEETPKESDEDIDEDLLNRLSK